MTASPPSVVFMGSKPGAVAALTLLLERRWRVPFVVVGEEDEPVWTGTPSLADFARSSGLTVVRQRELPPETRVDLVISYMFRHRVVAQTLAMGNVGALNFHAAPLPRYGGWAFYSVAILEDADEYGCTCHWMDEGFDSGPLLEVRRFPIDASEHTAVSLERLAQVEMIELFADVAGRVERGEELPRIPQSPEEMRYMTADEFHALKRLAPDADGASIERAARAFWYPPHEGAWLDLPGGRVEVVPAMAKAELAAVLHQSDLDRLLAAARATTAAVP